MAYLLLTVVVALVTAQGVLSKQYNIVAGKPKVFFFAGISAFSALVIFLFSSGGNLVVSKEYLPYSIGFGIAYVSTLAGEVLSIRWGALSITTLVSSYSLIIPAFYGIIMLGEKLSGIGIVGICCLICSIFLINDTKENAAFSFKYVISLIVMFVGNGMCSTIMKMQQNSCGGRYKNEFMIVALLIAGSVFMIISVAVREKRKEGLRACLGLGALKGTANGIVNALVLVLTGLIPNIILFPSVSAGGIVLGFLIAVCVYKERLSKRQLVGYVIGTVSVILLNL